MRNRQHRVKNAAPPTAELWWNPHPPTAAVGENQIKVNALIQRQEQQLAGVCDTFVQTCSDRGAKTAEKVLYLYY